jgi:mono/diheme cytochrome c family protein
MGRTDVKEVNMSVTRVCVPLLLACAWIGAQTANPKRIPKTWDEKALAEWATPVAGLNVRPTHMGAKEYYSLAVESLRTYPVYAPGREPEGYWVKLQKTAPQPLVDAKAIRSEADWVAAGKRVFEEVDFFHLRTLDRKYIDEVRKGSQAPSRVLPDGTLFGMRWVPTKQGVALSSSNCSFCHTLYLPDGTRVPGAPFRTIAPRPPDTFKVWPIISRLQVELGVLVGGPPFFMPGQTVGARLYAAYGVPWRSDDPHERLKAASQEQYEKLDLAARTSGGLPRWNGSILYPTKTPDLIGIRDRRYIDHTATHLHRDAGDLMRYAALVTSAEPTRFGAHEMAGPQTQRSRARFSDEALYALALYLYSLTPPANPNRFDDNAAAGERIFQREGCIQCHVPPLYTSNRLTLAEGFTPDAKALESLNILSVSVGTDPGLALMTRKGTGYYKVPSLKGVWYRGRFLHDGSLASLEEMFDPGRLKEQHLPGGWRPLETHTRAVKGHEFGLRLSAVERAQLIAFLRTL